MRVFGRNFTQEDWCITQYKRLASTCKFTMLHCCNIVCLQDGGGSCCKQNDVILTPCIRPLKLFYLPFLLLTNLQFSCKGFLQSVHFDWRIIPHTTVCMYTTLHCCNAIAYAQGTVKSLASSLSSINVNYDGVKMQKSDLCYA